MREAEGAGITIRLTNHHNHHNLVGGYHNRLFGPFAKPVTRWEVFPPMLLCHTDDENELVYIVRFGHENDDIRALVDVLAEQDGDEAAPTAWEVRPGHRHEIAEAYPGLRALVILPVSMADLTRREIEGSRTND